MKPMDSMQSMQKLSGKSPIKIKPSKEGSFTAWAKQHGFKSVQEAASAVLANKSKYSPAIVKKAVFAKNAKSWNHTMPSMSKLANK